MGLGSAYNVSDPFHRHLLHKRHKGQGFLEWLEVERDLVKCLAVDLDVVQHRLRWGGFLPGCVAAQYTLGEDRPRCAIHAVLGRCKEHLGSVSFCEPTYGERRFLSLQCLDWLPKGNEIASCHGLPLLPNRP